MPHARQSHAPQIRQIRVSWITTLCRWLAPGFTPHGNAGCVTSRTAGTDSAQRLQRLHEVQQTLAIEAAEMQLRMARQLSILDELIADGDREIARLRQTVTAPPVERLRLPDLVQHEPLRRAA